MENKVVRVIFTIIILLIGLASLGLSIFPTATMQGEQISSLSVLKETITGTYGDNMLVRLIESVFTSVKPYSEYKYFAGMIYFLLALPIALSFALGGLSTFISSIIAVVALGREEEEQAYRLKIASFFLMGGIGGTGLLSYAGILKLTLMGKIGIYMGIFMFAIYLSCIFFDIITKTKLSLIIVHRLSKILMLGMTLELIKLIYEKMIEGGATPGYFCLLLVSIYTLPVVLGHTLHWDGNRIIERIHLTFLLLSHGLISIPYIYHIGFDAVLTDSFVISSTALLIGIYMVYLIAFDHGATVVILDAMSDVDLSNVYEGRLLYKGSKEKYSINIFPFKRYMRDYGVMLGYILAIGAVDSGIYLLFKWIFDGNVGRINDWSSIISGIATFLLGTYFVISATCPDYDFNKIRKSTGVTMFHIPLLPISLYFLVDHCNSMEWETRNAAFGWDWVIFCMLLFAFAYIMCVLFHAFINKCDMCGFLETKITINREIETEDRREFKKVGEQRWTETNTYYKDGGDTKVYEEITYIEPEHYENKGVFRYETVSGRERCCVCSHVTTFNYTTRTKISD